MGGDHKLVEPTCLCFFFTKPHAVNAKVEKMVQDTLAKYGIKVIAQGNKAAAQIKAEGIMDMHYGTLADRAVKVSPKDLPKVPDKVEEKCRSCFGKSWSELLASGKVYNLEEAEARMCPEWGYKEIETEWRRGDYVKLFPGTYVASMTVIVPDTETIYVVNGFYGSMRAMFESDDSAPSGVDWKVLEWPESTLSWDDFRDKVVGPTKIDDAPVTSLKGMLRDNFRELGLEKVPYGAENGFHASASALESFRERQIWLKEALTKDEFEGLEFGSNDPVTKFLREIGSEDGNNLCKNPSVSIDGAETNVFDAVEHKNPTDCLRILRQVQAEL